MTSLLKFATFLIAACALSTGAMAQKTIYRCGSNYSQVPCEGAVSVDASDARTQADKREADKATQRDMKQGKDMEKMRIKEEKEALAQNRSANASTSKAVAGQPEKADAGLHEKAKRSKHKKKEPEFFTAKAAPEKKKD